MDEDVKRWTARRKSALVLEIIQGKTTVAEASRHYDLTPSEVEEWVEHFLLVPEAATQKHLEILSEIAELLSNGSLRDALLGSPSADALHSLIARWSPAS